jgi:phage FluMu protein Com
MPIRFRCVYCGQLLSIATRKSGSKAECPKCSHPNVVPAPEQEPTRSTMKVSRAFESQQFDEWIGRSLVAERAESVSVGTADAADSDSGVVEAPASSESSSAVVEPWRSELERLPAEQGEGGDDEPTLSRRRTLLVVIAAVLLILTAFGLGVLVGAIWAPAVAA